MTVISNPIANAVEQLANALETNQSRFNRAMYDAQPENIQKVILQNCYNNDISVEKISKMTGVPKSTVYSKITTK
jgi:predicted DNA-binding protein YlxM (UPF0122 family)